MFSWLSGPAEIKATLNSYGVIAGIFAASLTDASVEPTTAVWNLQNSSSRFDVTRRFEHVVLVLIVPTDKNMTFNPSDRFTRAQLVVNQGKCGVPEPSTQFFVL